MATAAQIAANQRNARRSTGPRTEDGKAKSRLNALQHGLSASISVFLPHEDPIRFHQMRAALLETWQPANAQEMLLVNQICQGWWATERSARFENGFFNNQLRTRKARNHAPVTPHANDDEGIAISLTDPENESGCRTLFRYEDRAWSKYYRAMDRLRKLQADRRKLEARQPPPQPSETEEETPELASFGQTEQTPPPAPSAEVEPCETPSCPASTAPSPATISTPWSLIAAAPSPDRTISPCSAHVE